MFQAPNKSQPNLKKNDEKDRNDRFKKENKFLISIYTQFAPHLAPSVIEDDCNPRELWSCHDKKSTLKKFLYRAKWQQTRKTSVEILSTKRTFSGAIEK